MKKTILIIGALLLVLTGCKKTVFGPEEYANIEGTIDDITSDEGISVYTIDLSQAFSVPNSPGRVVTHSIESNSNPTLVTPQIDGHYLNLVINVGTTGSSTIKLRSETDRIYKETEFTLTLNPITADEAMSRAIGFFAQRDYESALSHFTLVTKKNNSAFLSDAYMGMGFSQMRLGMDDKQYGYGSFQLSIGFNDQNTDARAGLSLLEYAYKRNYDEAIAYGEQVLSKAPDYTFKYDSTLDKNDIMLNIALSQYSNQEYNDCLNMVKKLDPTTALSSSDPDFETLLFEKLEELLGIYS